MNLAEQITALKDARYDDLLMDSKYKGCKVGTNFACFYMVDDDRCEITKNLKRCDKAVLNDSISNAAEVIVLRNALNDLFEAMSQIDKHVVLKPLVDNEVGAAELNAAVMNLRHIVEETKKLELV